ncbi:hypothetical protein [Cupriavidus sp. RAF12]
MPRFDLDVLSVTSTSKPHKNASCSDGAAGGHRFAQSPAGQK